jgi:purine catabolism regulator
MGLTVREAMQIGGLTRCKVVAGEKGLDRTIDHITVMEVPDVIQWLKDHVFLLTSLYAIKDDAEAISHLVDQLSEVGCSALAIKTQRFVKEIPKVIIEEGNRLRLPIIEIEEEVPFLDIMTPLMELILRKFEPGHERMESYFQWITELVMSGKGIPTLIDAVQQMTENLITVGSEVAALESFAHGRNVTPLTRIQKNEIKTAKRSIRMQRMLDGQITPCIVTPLLLNDELCGDVTCWQTMREFLERDFYVLDRTVLLIGMEFLKVMTKAEVEQTYRDDFFTELLVGNVNDHDKAIEKGKLFGFDLTQNYQVLSIAYTDRPLGDKSREMETLGVQERRRKLLRKVGEIFRFGADNISITARKELIVVLYPRENGKSEEGLIYQSDPKKSFIMDLAATIQRQLSAEFEDLEITIGIGRLYPGLEGIHKGYTESFKAIQLGKPISGESGLIHYEDLGIYRILSQLNDWEEMESLYAETVGKLVEYDWGSKASLVNTLTEYFANNCVLAETAKRLFIHINTMKYRLHKIEQLTGCSVHDAEKRLLLHLGLKIHQILQSDNM